MNRFVSFITHQWTIRTGFFLIFVGSIIRLLAFERWARGEGDFVSRPEAVAGLLPVGHYTSFFAWIKGAGFDYLLPAGLVIIIASITISFLFKRGFCAYVCPLGTVMEAPALLGRKLMGRNFRLPKWIDYAGRFLQVGIGLILIIWLASVSVQEALSFRQLPYMWIADIKIIHTLIEPIFLSLFLLAFAVSFLFSPLWCRYLCPLGGFYSAIGVFSPSVITRNAETCISCGKCDKACDAFCDPSEQIQVRDNTCDGCMECVKVCPVENCLEARLFGKIKIDHRVWSALVVLIWVFIIGAAMALGLWGSQIPPEVFKQIINSGIIESQTPLF